MTKHFKRKTMLAMLICLVTTMSAYAQNELQNPGFENNPPTANGNNIGYSIAPWQLGPGQDSNVVRVDGPGGFDYAQSGPESDASGTSPGTPRHYLDIKDGNNIFWQTFTATCDGTVNYGGFFSTRDNLDGSALIEMRDGPAPSDPVLGSPTAINLPAGDSKLDPWVEFSDFATVSAGQVVTFVVTMDNNLNFDEGYVKFTKMCSQSGNGPVLGGTDPDIFTGTGSGSTPTADPCCPPWTVDDLKSMMTYVGTGGITDPYTLRFNPTQTFLNKMQAYIDYVKPMTGASSITIHFKIYDYGVAGTGGTLPPSSSRFVTWTAGGNGAPTNGPINFFDAGNSVDLMQVGRWYRIATGIYLNDDIKFFGDDCAERDFKMRIQVLQSGEKQPQVILELQDASGEITETTLNVDQLRK